jgi:hypothetical protein
MLAVKTAPERPTATKSALRAAAAPRALARFSPSARAAALRGLQSRMLNVSLAYVAPAESGCTSSTTHIDTDQMTGPSHPQEKQHQSHVFVALSGITCAYSSGDIPIIVQQVVIERLCSPAQRKNSHECPCDYHKHDRRRRARDDYIPPAPCHHGAIAR